jgi:RNA polymerase sigma-70 factor (ECF subfamily)
LRQVSRNLFISAQRRAARAVAVAELDEIEAAWSRWAANDDGRELLAALQKCLETLASKARQALELRFREEQSRANIAAVLGMSEDGAKNLMQRAKQHLRTCIERTLRC